MNGLASSDHCPVFLIGDFNFREEENERYEELESSYEDLWFVHVNNIPVHERDEEITKGFTYHLQKNDLVKFGKIPRNF